MAAGGIYPGSYTSSAAADMETLQLAARYAIIQQHLAAAAAAAAVSTGRLPAYSQPPPLFGSRPPSELSPPSSTSSSSFYPSFPGLFPPLAPHPSASLAAAGASYPSSYFGADPLIHQAYLAAAAAALASGSSSTSVASSLFPDFSPSQFKQSNCTTSTPACSTHSPGCKDPYCFRCQLSAAFPLPTAPSGGSIGPSSPVDKSALPPPSSSSQAYLPPSLHAALFLQQLQQQQQPPPPSSDPACAATSSSPSASVYPYVCSWVDAGLSEFCGKRFSSSDELLRHLTTHAAAAAAAASSPASSSFLGGPPSLDRYLSLPSTAGLPSHQAMQAAAFAAAAAAAGYPAPPSRMSPPSPVVDQAVGLAAAQYGSAANGLVGLHQYSSRYHPYIKPTSASSSMPSPSASGRTSSPYRAALSGGSSSAASAGGHSAGSSSSSAAALQAAAYFSPYAAALYGQRLGEATVGP